MDNAVLEEDDNPFFAAPQHEQQHHHHHHHSRRRDLYERPFGNSNNNKSSNDDDHADHDVVNDELVLMAHETFGAAFEPRTVGNDNDGDVNIINDIFLTASLEHPDAAAADHWDIMKDSPATSGAPLFPEEEDDNNDYHDQQPLLDASSEMSSSGRRQKVLQHDYHESNDELVVKSFEEEEEVTPPPLEDVSSQSEKTEEEDGDDGSSHDDDDYGEHDDDENENDDDNNGADEGENDDGHYPYESETGESYDRFLHALKKFAPREEWPTLQTAVEHRNNQSGGGGVGAAPAAHHHHSRSSSSSGSRLQQQPQPQQQQTSEDHHHDHHPHSTPARGGKDNNKTSKSFLNTTAQTANTTMTVEADDENEQQQEQRGQHHHHQQQQQQQHVSPRLARAAVRGAGMAVLHAAKSSTAATAAAATAATATADNNSTSSSISTAFLDVAPAAGGGGGRGGTTPQRQRVVVSVSSSPGGVQRFNKLSKRLSQQQQSFPSGVVQNTSSSRTREPSPKRQTSAKRIVTTTTEAAAGEDATISNTTAGGTTCANRSRYSSRTSATNDVTTSSMSTPLSHPSSSSGTATTTTAPLPVSVDATERRSNRGASASPAATGGGGGGVLGPVASAAQRALKQAAATAATNRRLQHPQTRQEAQLELDILATAAALATAASLESKNGENGSRRSTVAATRSMTAPAGTVGRVVTTLEQRQTSTKKVSSSFTNAPVGRGVARGDPYGSQRTSANGGGGGTGMHSNAEDEAQQRQSLEQIFLDLMRAEKRAGTKIYNHPPPPQLVSSTSSVSTSTFPILPSSNRPPRSIRQQQHTHKQSAYSPASSSKTTSTGTRSSTASQSSTSSNRRRRSSSATRATMATTSGGITGRPFDTTTIITPDRQSSKQGQEQKQGTMVRSASSPSLSTQSPESSIKDSFFHAMEERPLFASTDGTSTPWAHDPMAEADVRYQIPSMSVESKQARPVLVDNSVSEQGQSASQAPALSTNSTGKLQDAAALESYSEESLTSIDQKELDTSILTAFLDYVGAEKDEVTNRTLVRDIKRDKNSKFPSEDEEDAGMSIQSESTTSLVVCAVPGRNGSLSGNAQSFCVLNSISEALESISGEGIPFELALMRDRCIDQCDRIPCVDSSHFTSRDADADEIRQSTTVLSASESFTTRDSSLGVTLPREEQSPLVDFYFFEELVKEMAEMEFEEISKIPCTGVHRTNVEGADRLMNGRGVDRSETLSPDTSSRASTTLHQFQTEFPRLYDRLVLLFGTDRLKKLASGKFQKDSAKKLIEELIEQTKRSSDAAGAGTAMETNSSRDWLLDTASTASSTGADQDQQQRATKVVSPPGKSTGNGYSRSLFAAIPALPITPSALSPSAMALLQTPASNGVAGERPVSPPNLNRTATIQAPPVPPSPATTGTSGSGPLPKRPSPDVSPAESLAPLSPRRSHGSCPTTASPLNALMGDSFRGGCDEEDPVGLLLPERRHFLDDLALPSIKDHAKMSLQSKALLANLTAARTKNELWSKNPPPEESPLAEQQQHHQESLNDAPEPQLTNSSRGTKPRRFLRNFALLHGGQKKLQTALHDDAEDNVIVAARKMRALRNPLKATKSADAEVTEDIWNPTETLETHADTFKGVKSVKRRKGLRRAFMKSEKIHAQDSVSLLVRQPLPADDDGDKTVSEVATVGWEAFDPYQNETPVQHSPPSSPPATDRQDPPGERALTSKRIDSMPTTVSSLIYGESHPKFAEFGPVEYTRGDMEYDVVGREITVISSD